MAAAGKRRILVTLDGSEASLDTVRYLAHVFSGSDVEMTLFSVIPRAPESFWDLAPEPDPSLSSAWKTHRLMDLESCMHQARRLLMEAGIAQANILEKIQEREAGIARDIIRESQAGYDALVTGRVGMNPFTRLVLGSVANKLIDSVEQLPVWVVSRSVRSKKFLLALDSSPGAMRCVSFAGWMLAGTDTEFTLFHILRDYDLRRNQSGRTEPEGSALDQWLQKGQAELEKAKRAMHAVTRQAASELERAGIAAERITSKIMTGVASRAGAILAQAILGGYSTIVIGRRGLSQVSDFRMGRVCNKVLQLGNEVTVWVVS